VRERFRGSRGRCMHHTFAWANEKQSVISAESQGAAAIGREVAHDPRARGFHPLAVQDHEAIDQRAWQPLPVLLVDPIEAGAPVAAAVSSEALGHELEAIGGMVACGACAPPERKPYKVVEGGRIHRREISELRGRIPTFSAVSTRYGNREPTESRAERKRSSMVVSLSPAPMPT